MPFIVLILLALLPSPSRAQGAILELHAGVVSPPEGYRLGPAIAVTGSVARSPRLQLRLDYGRAGADEDSGYGSVVPDAVRSTVSALLLLQLGRRAVRGSAYWGGFIGAGYAWSGEEGTSILGGATVDRSGAGPAFAAGLKLGFAGDGPWRIELEPSLLATYADPYGTDTSAAYSKPIRLGVAWLF